MTAFGRFHLYQPSRELNLSAGCCVKKTLATGELNICTSRPSPAIVTAPCEQERRALCHAEQLSDSPAGSDRGGRTSPAMSRLERRGPPPAAHQLLQQVPGEPGGGRALLQKVCGGERRLARRLLHAESVPVQRERPETPAHVAGGPLGQQLRLPV